mmetsp:Transcript_7748/g.24200  ORF Transcript_7748/g.24200 Transcript_7748/m.24200 type:complete len:147 (-) Transcript_7748:1088-1528(-)|eukprot:scaffold192288_cov35-Tisochrysis_lutea.AAC.2
MSTTCVGHVEYASHQVSAGAAMLSRRRAQSPLKRLYGVSSTSFVVHCGGSLARPLSLPLACVLPLRRLSKRNDHHGSPSAALLETTPLETSCPSCLSMSNPAGDASSSHDPATGECAIEGDGGIDPCCDIVVVSEGTGDLCEPPPS